METTKNRQRFVELAEKRVTRAVKDLRLIGNLSNRSNYSYTSEDVHKITETLKIELRRLEKRFSNSRGDEPFKFKLMDKA